MAILTRDQIVDRIKSNNLGFKPGLDSFQLRSHAVDLRLGFTFLVPKRWQMTKKGREGLFIDHFNPEVPQYFDVIELEEGQYFEILPNEYILVSTLELIKVPNDLMGILYPRSSTNRRGLSVDLTGIIDSGYEGPLTIPVRNNTQTQTIRLHPGERFCQVTFEELGSAVKAVKSRYHQKDIIEGYVKEKSSLETKMILKGDIKKLKKDFGL